MSRSKTAISSLPAPTRDFWLRNGELLTIFASKTSHSTWPESRSTCLRSMTKKGTQFRCLLTFSLVWMVSCICPRQWTSIGLKYQSQNLRLHGEASRTINALKSCTRAVNSGMRDDDQGRTKENCSGQRCRLQKGLRSRVEERSIIDDLGAAVSLSRQT